MSLIKSLGLAWTVWKITTKRFGPVGGLVVATVAVVAYVFLKSKFGERHPEITKVLE